ncbi:MAG: hypothetical protein SH857_12315 [Chitinophagales bacterium]|nr:hypothetical protein [Chitinophagales bacterium]
MIAKRYNKFRKLKLTTDEFNILCLLTPCYLVAHADGHFDKDEQKIFDDFLLGFFEGYVKKKITAAQLQKLKNIYVMELAFIKSDAVWLIHILDYLRSFAESKKEIREIVNTTMLEVAVISGNVSGHEKSVMQFVIKNLK